MPLRVNKILLPQSDASVNNDGEKMTLTSLLCGVAFRGNECGISCLTQIPNRTRAAVLSVSTHRSVWKVTSDCLLVARLELPSSTHPSLKGTSDQNEGILSSTP